MSELPANPVRLSRPLRCLLWCAGALSLLLGIIGIFLPIFPTTPFVLLTAACWAKASPRWRHWLVSQKYVGPMIERWERDRAITPTVRWLALGTISCSVLFSAWLLRALSPWITVAIVVLALTAVAFILYLPVVKPSATRS
ncbi:MAG TPA: YbaN family protein [Rhodanobacteraceae bacterium]|nr:YbaN family protein [Rhodanobacteraceae bacterium]